MGVHGNRLLACLTPERVKPSQTQNSCHRPDIPLVTLAFREQLFNQAIDWLLQPESRFLEGFQGVKACFLQMFSRALHKLSLFPIHGQHLHELQLSIKLMPLHHTLSRGLVSPHSSFPFCYVIYLLVFCSQDVSPPVNFLLWAREAERLTPGGLLGTQVCIRRLLFL